jgi:hypothetical protein
VALYAAKGAGRNRIIISSAEDAGSDAPAKGPPRERRMP